MKRPGVLLLLAPALLLAACGSAPGADRTAPSVALEVSPGVLTASGPVTLRATTSDDKGVTKVSFYREGTLLGTDQTAPYEASDTVAVTGGGQVRYSAVAEDAAGNRAEAGADVTLSLTTLAGTVVEGQPQVAADGTPGLTLSAWTGGAGTLGLGVPDPQTQRAVGVTSTALAADGTFRLTLPEVEGGQLQALTPSSCPNTLTFSDPQARGASAALSVEAGKAGTVLPYRVVAADPAGMTVESGLLVYVDRTTTLDGAVTCPFYTEVYRDLTLSRGWNRVGVTERSGSDGGETFTYTGAPFPDQWVYLNALTQASLGSRSPVAPRFSPFPAPPR